MHADAKAGVPAATISRVNTLSDSLRLALHLIVQMDESLLSIVARSLAVSGLATAMAFVLGASLGAGMAVANFRGRAALLIVLNTMLALPAVVVGLVVYVLLSRSGPLGHLGWLFSFQAMVMAQTVLVLPVVAALVQQAVHDNETAHGEQLRAMGAGACLRALLHGFDLRYVWLTIALVAFGRAIAEVGAVMIVGGNIDGFTRVMTTAIALETSKGDLPLALALGLVLLALVLLLNVAVALIRRWRQNVEAAA